jgi:peptidoglycan lytic transglycosylase A
VLRPLCALSFALVALALPAQAQQAPVLERVADDALPPFDQDDLDRDSLRQAIAEERRLLAGRPDEPVSLGGIAVRRGDLLRTLERLDALLAQDLDGAELGAAIAAGFDCYRSVGSDGEGRVLFTGYHSPCYEASRERTEELTAAVRRAPAEVAGGPFRPGRPTFTRRQIEAEGALDGRDLELVWMAPLDAYLLEVQGSGSALLPDGEVVRLQCSHSNGRAYTSLGREMIRDGRLTPEEASIPAIRAYFAANPDTLREYLLRNESYVFFVETDLLPQGCGGAAVTAGRSIATDKRHFPTGGLALVVIEMPVIEDGEVVRWERRARLMIDQDTGGAIRGPGRVDLYMGADPDAGLAAGVMNREGALYYLLAR